jgi:hypothetical protein
MEAMTDLDLANRKIKMLEACLIDLMMHRDIDCMVLSAKRVENTQSQSYILEQYEKELVLKLI